MMLMKMMMVVNITQFMYLYNPKDELTIRSKVVDSHSENEHLNKTHTHTKKENAAICKMNKLLSI